MNGRQQLILVNGKIKKNEINELIVSCCKDLEININNFTLTGVAYISIQATPQDWYTEPDRERVHCPVIASSGFPPSNA